jgi:hypothetical protein
MNHLTGGTMINNSEPNKNDNAFARRCPKYTKQSKIKRRKIGWLSSALDLVYHKLSKNLLIIGPISLAWLLFRSLRKPSRLQYPCQQMALMQGSLFVGFIAYKGSDRFSLPKQLPKLLAKTGLILAAMLLVNMIGVQAKQLLKSPVDVNHLAITAATVPQGKVVRVHSSTATNWDFSSVRYWDHIDRSEVQAMLDVKRHFPVHGGRLSPVTNLEIRSQSK